MSLNGTKPGQVSPWNYAIIQAARHAHEALCSRSLTPAETRQCLALIRFGQEAMARLEAEGGQLPEIDLTYPPPVPAAVVR